MHSPKLDCEFLAIRASLRIPGKYAGCVECGTCRISCEATIVRKRVNTGPTMGVRYRFG